MSAVLTSSKKYPLQTFIDRGKQGNAALLQDVAVNLLLPQPLSTAEAIPTDTLIRDDAAPLASLRLQHQINS